MEIEYFTHFLRKFYPTVSMTNEEAIHVGEEFKDYLEKLFPTEEGKQNLNTIWNISPRTIIFGDGSPNRIHGYHPAFVYHFTEFIKIRLDQLENNDK
jgi:hypothetical protein